MKTKKMRLELNKKTITNLNNADLISVVGGKTLQSCPPEMLCISENTGCYSPTDACGTEVNCPGVTEEFLCLTENPGCVSYPFACP